MDEAIPTPRRRWLFTAIGVLILIAAALIGRGLIATAPHAQRQAPQRSARLVETVTLQPQPQRVEITAYGEVEAAQQLTLAGQVAGTVVALGPNFVPGARVKAGELLVQVDPADYELAVRKAQADLASAEASLALEQGNQAVVRGDAALLGMELAPSEQSLMLRQPQLRSAEAAVDTAKAALDQARLNLARAALRAPFEALVLSRDIAVGGQINGRQTTVGELAAASPFWVMLRVPVADLDWINAPAGDGKGGSTVMLVDSSRPNAAPWSGHVIQIVDAVEADGRRAQVLVEVDPDNENNGTHALLLGTYVQARILGKTLEDAYALDPAWVQDDQVWRVVDGRLQAAPVQIVHRNDSRVLVSDGLQAGDVVVSSLLASAVDGMRVRTADSEPEPDATPARTP